MAVDGGIKRTQKGMTGGVGMVVFRLRQATPSIFDVESISVRGRYFDHERKVTNNTMELMGFSIMASNMVDELWAGGTVDPTPGSIDVEFWSDSQYALGILFRPKWIPKKNKMLVKNTKAELDDLTKFARVTGRFIRGHQGHFINEFADLVAALCIKREADISHELAFDEIEDRCLFCDNFPCRVREDYFDIEPIKEWKEKFEAIRALKYTLVCANRKPYDAEFVLTRAPHVDSDAPGPPERASE